MLLNEFWAKGAFYDINGGIIILRGNDRSSARCGSCQLFSKSRKDAEISHYVGFPRSHACHREMDVCQFGRSFLYSGGEEDHQFHRLLALVLYISLYCGVYEVSDPQDDSCFQYLSLHLQLCRYLPASHQGGILQGLCLYHKGESALL